MAYSRKRGVRQEVVCECNLRVLAFDKNQIYVLQSRNQCASIQIISIYFYGLFPTTPVPFVLDWRLGLVFFTRTWKKSYCLPNFHIFIWRIAFFYTFFWLEANVMHNSK